MAEIKKNILIVCKEEQILAFLEKMFAVDFIVNRAADIMTGIEASRREKPAAVILDIDDAEVDAVKHVPQFKGSGPGARVWTLCSKDNFEAAKNSLLAGASGYVLKPYKIDDWKNVVHSIKTGSAPAAEEPARAVKAPAEDGPWEDVAGGHGKGSWHASGTVRVLGGIAAGLGYVSIPFYLIMFSHVSSCAGSSSLYCAKNGSLACSIFYGYIGCMMLAGPLILPVGLGAIFFNVVAFLVKKRLGHIDLLAILLGVGMVSLIMLSAGANPSCGIM